MSDSLTSPNDGFQNWLSTTESYIAGTISFSVFAKKIEDIRNQLRPHLADASTSVKVNRILNKLQDVALDELRLMDINPTKQKDIIGKRTDDILFQSPHLTEVIFRTNAALATIGIDAVGTDLLTQHAMEHIHDLIHLRITDQKSDYMMKAMVEDWLHTAKEYCDTRVSLAEMSRKTADTSRLIMHQAGAEHDDAHFRLVLKSAEVEAALTLRDEAIIEVANDDFDTVIFTYEVDRRLILSNHAMLFMSQFEALAKIITHYAVDNKLRTPHESAETIEKIMHQVYTRQDELQPT